MNQRDVRGVLCAGLLGALACSPVQADAIRVSMTVDNSYALFVGTQTAATTFIGGDSSWPTTETYNFDLADSAYLYVVTASDKSTAQGFLGQFENLTANYKFYSQDPQWQVMATGLGTAAPYSGSAADMALLTQEILDANGGGNASNGWTNFTAGLSNGASPWGPMTSIDAAAKWVWYAGGNCNQINPTIGGCDANEWLVFRIAAAATPDDPTPNGSVPEPNSLALAGLAIVLAGVARRRRAT